MVADMMDTIQDLLKNRAKAKSREEENKALRRKCDRLRTEVRKTEKQREEEKERVVASRRTLREIKENLAIPIHIVNKARLFEDWLEKEEKLSHEHIIRYLGVHARKMDQTWEQMRLLLGRVNPGERVQQATQMQGRVTTLPTSEVPPALVRKQPNQST